MAQVLTSLSIVRVSPILYSCRWNRTLLTCPQYRTWNPFAAAVSLLHTCRHTHAVPPPVLSAILPDGDESSSCATSPSHFSYFSSSPSWTTSCRCAPCALLRSSLVSTVQPHCATPLDIRGYHTSLLTYFPDKKATVEKAVDSAKEKKEKKKNALEVAASASKEFTPLVEDSRYAGSLFGFISRSHHLGSLEAVNVEVSVKSSLTKRVLDVLLQYYHGFRLLALDMQVAFRLLLKTMKGNLLTRRERKQFRRTVGDIFRVVPFSVFVVIPFMEFLLPVYLWLFPNALPSTFQTQSSKETRKMKQLKVKIQMAKFLQDTIEEMAVASKNPNKKESVEEFAQFFYKIRSSGEQATTEELVKFSQLFEDELTLDNLSSQQLVALSKLLLLQSIGTNNFLRFQLRMKLRMLRADDIMIQKESVASLTDAELQAASQARGMQALGMPKDRLKSQLEQWLDLHLVQKIPASLLLLSRALYLPDDTPASDALQVTLSKLPESIIDEAELLVADTSGENVDNKTRLDLLRQQEELIREEAKEKELEKEALLTSQLGATQSVSEEMVDSSPILSSSKTPPIQHVDGTDVKDEVSISSEELIELSHAMSSLKKDEDRTTLEELKEDREEYIEDVADLAEECKDELQESKASVRLGRRVDAMISKIESVLQQLEGTSAEDSSTLYTIGKDRKDVISTVKLEEALEALRGLSGEAKTRSIVAVLDEDHDGNINLDEIAEVIESLALEDTNIKPEHIEQIKELIKKEVHVEEADKPSTPS